MVALLVAYFYQPVIIKDILFGLWMNDTLNNFGLRIEEE